MHGGQLYSALAFGNIQTKIAVYDTALYGAASELRPVSLLSNQIKSHLLHFGSHEAGLVTR